MSCDSWIFVHKHIANCDDGNGRVIERKVFWNHKSWEVGHHFTVAFGLDSGYYTSTCREDLLLFVNKMIQSLDRVDNQYDYDECCSLLKELERSSDDYDYFVSIDW